MAPRLVVVPRDPTPTASRAPLTREAPRRAPASEEPTARDAETAQLWWWAMGI